MTDRGHPVRREPHFVELDVGRREIGQRLADRHARRGGRVEQRERRALAHRHRLAGVAFEIVEHHRAIGDRHLPRPDHRIARAESADRAIADRDQERLAADRRHAQHARDRIVEPDAVDIGDEVEALGRVLRVAVHARRLAEQHVERKIDDRAIGRRNAGARVARRSGDARRWRGRRPRTGSARARRAIRSRADIGVAHAEHVALLRFVAPDLHRR